MSEPSEEARSNFSKVVYAALVSAVFTVIASVTAYYFTTKSPKLTYTVSEGPVLSSPKGFTSIYSVGVTNDGKTEVDSVACVVTLSAGSIEDAKTRINPAISMKESKSESDYRVMVPSLNPGEGFTVGLMVETPSENGEPQVGVRGRGVTAERNDQSRASTQGKPSTVAGGVLAVLIIFSATFLMIVRRGRLPALFSSGPYDRNERVAHILNAVGLHEEAERVRFAPSEMTFMGSADYIAGVALREPAKGADCALALKALLIVDGIAKSSRNVIVGNLRRIEGDAFDSATVESVRRRAKGSDEASLRERIDTLVSELKGAGTDAQ